MSVIWVDFLLKFNWVFKILTVSVQNHTWRVYLVVLRRSWRSWQISTLYVYLLLIYDPGISNMSWIDIDIYLFWMANFSLDVIIWIYILNQDSWYTIYKMCWIYIDISLFWTVKFHAWPWQSVVGLSVWRHLCGNQIHCSGWTGLSIFFF